MQLSFTIIIVAICLLVCGLVVLTIFGSQMGKVNSSIGGMQMSVASFQCAWSCQASKSGDCPPNTWGEPITGYSVSCFDIVGNCECPGENFMVVSLDDD
jgi:hypothetical protein